MTHAPGGNSVIEISNFSFSIGKKEILRDVSFSVREQEYLTIVGPNGAGKTTLLKCLDRIYTGGTGQIHVFGRTLTTFSQRDLAQCWEQTDDQPPNLVPSAWLDGGPVTTVAELREASPGITVLMAEDLNRVNAKRKDLARLVLPMPPPPKEFAWRDWSRERGLPIAPAGTIDYDPLRGAQWQKK